MKLRLLAGSLALATIAAAEHVGVAPEVSAKALGSFGNVRRRLELSGEAGGGRPVLDS